MVAAETDVVLLEFNGPKGGIQLPVLIFAVCVDSTHKSHQQNHEDNNDSKDDDIELGP